MEDLVQHIGFILVLVVLGYIANGIIGSAAATAIYFSIDRIIARWKTGSWTGTMSDVKEKREKK